MIVMCTPIGLVTARLVAREYNNSKREDVFSPATSPLLTKLIPILAWQIDGVFRLTLKMHFCRFPRRDLHTARFHEEKEVKQYMEWKPNAGDLVVSFLNKEMLVFCGANFVQNFCSKKAMRKAFANPALLDQERQGRIRLHRTCR